MMLIWMLACTLAQRSNATRRRLAVDHDQWSEVFTTNEGKEYQWKGDKTACFQVVEIDDPQYDYYSTIIRCPKPPKEEEKAPEQSVSLDEVLKEKGVDVENKGILITLEWLDDVTDLDLVLEMPEENQKKHKVDYNNKKTRGFELDLDANFGTEVMKTNGKIHALENISLDNKYIEHDDYLEGTYKVFVKNFRQRGDKEEHRFNMRVQINGKEERYEDLRIGSVGGETFLIGTFTCEGQEFSPFASAIDKDIRDIPQKVSTDVADDSIAACAELKKACQQWIRYVKIITPKYGLDKMYFGIEANGIRCGYSQEQFWLDVLERLKEQMKKQMTSAKRFMTWKCFKTLIDVYMREEWNDWYNDNADDAGYTREIHNSIYEFTKKCMEPEFYTSFAEYFKFGYFVSVQDDVGAWVKYTGEDMEKINARLRASDNPYATIDGTEYALALQLLKDEPIEK